ncbi:MULTISPECIES: 4'-phosphopantetheinyl transferase family protein [unclassified Streptomyces]|uniref:4'-phosphopantetheinyl transferase family protein n=1 Tax=unclassified Streptomyces TaxID=2593676 RepID=UPI0036EF4806
MTAQAVLWLVRADPPVPPTSLNAGERRRARTLAGVTERDRYVAAHTALRRHLAARLGVPPPQVALTRERCPVCGAPHGRPAVVGGSPHFSLAYSDDLALVAVADTPVGVDMERIPPPDVVDGLIPHLHPRERDELVALPEGERPLAFARTWVRKEAYLKGLGTGLSRGLATDYVGTGAAPAEDPPGWMIARVTVGGRRTAAIAVGV